MKWIAWFVCSPLLLTALQASAQSKVQPVRSVSAQQAQGLAGEIVEVKVHPARWGNTVLNFRPTNESVRQVSLGIPERITLSSDDPECLSSEASRSGRERCEASVLYLQQSPGSEKEPIAASRMTILTDKHLYLFKLLLTNSAPEYYALEIKPENQPAQAALTTLEQLETLLRGVKVATERNYLANPELAGRVQHFIQLLREGKEIETSANSAGISLNAVRKLEQLGQSTPLPQPLSPAPVNQ